VGSLLTHIFKRKLPQLAEKEYDRYVELGTLHEFERSLCWSFDQVKIHFDQGYEVSEVHWEMGDSKTGYVKLSR
jgi:hypothetical protein